MTDSLKKFAEHWVKHIMSARNELAFMTQRLHQKSMSLRISLENWTDSTWWSAYK